MKIRAPIECRETCSPAPTLTPGADQGARVQTRRVVVSHLHVAGYRSVRDLELRRSRLNVLVGTNGCGMSNLYRALKLLPVATCVDGMEFSLRCELRRRTSTRSTQ